MDSNPHSYFRNGPNRCSHRNKVVHKAYQIRDVPLSRSARRGAARRSFATSQKSRPHNQSYVRTEALPGMINVAVLKRSGIV